MAACELEHGLDWGVGGSRAAGLGTTGRGELMVSRDEWRWDGRVHRRLLIDADESEVGRCMGDARASDGWIATTGEHVSLFGCSCVACVINQN